MKPPVAPLLLLLLLLLLLGPALAAALRVLGIFPMNGHSHSVFFKALTTALVDRGHQVTMVSPLPLKKPRPNYTDVDVSDVLPPVRLTVKDILMRGADTPLLRIPILIQSFNGLFGESLCRKLFSHPKFQRLMESARGQYDVVLTEVFGSDCFAAVAHKLQLPLVSLSSAPDMTWMHDRVGSIDNPSYIPLVFTRYVERMLFFERLINTAEYLLGKYLFEKHLQDGQDALVREFFGEDMPPIVEMVRNTSLVIVNRHVSIHPARPLTPNVVHAGGMHLQAPKPVAAELDSWMRAADHGVVFFSLGTVVREETIPVETLSALLRSFAAIPQRVIWKFDGDHIPELPPNVRVSPWLPQRDILAHPKTVLFITHGGLMGTMEALQSGVPMLGMPMFGDQMSNMNLYKSLGIAEQVSLFPFDGRAFLNTLKTMVEDGRYFAQAKAVAARFSDRPRGALEEAVWWVEYVARHRGAPHLRPLGADLPLHEYLLLDVAAAVVLSVAVLLAAFALAARAVFRALRLHDLSLPPSNKAKRE